MLPDIAEAKGLLDQLMDFSNGLQVKVYQVLFFFVACLVCYSYSRRAPITFHTAKGSRLEKAIEQSRINELEFQPYWFAPNNFMQGVCFTLYDLYLYQLKKHKTTVDREIFKLKDGGQIALDWVVDEYGGKPHSETPFPILAILSGLVGGEENLYNFDVVEKAREAGFKVVLISHRGTCGLKLTSPKFYDALSSDDLDEASSHIFNTYCKKQKRKLHGYCVSLGGLIFTRYLIYKGKASPYTSVASNGNIWDLEASKDFFCQQSFYGMCCKAFG